MSITPIPSLDAVADRYAVIYCDIWGVIHDGVTASAPAWSALERLRETGKTVVLITNSPRLHPGVARQIADLGVPETAYDAIVTSGDVTRELVASGPRDVYHLGPARDHGLYEGLDVALVDPERAEIIVCTGLENDEVETPDDYAERLAAFFARDVPLVCANPDLRVERGGRLIFCAGSIAAAYRALGGRILVAGKPHKPIYDQARALAARKRGVPVADLGAGLAIGDGLATDIKGAIDNGLDAVFVSGGIDRSVAGLDEELASMVEGRGTGFEIFALPQLR